MDEKTAKELKGALNGVAEALDRTTRALQEHSKLLSAITGKKAPPRPPEPARSHTDPLTRLLEGQR